MVAVDTLLEKFDASKEKVRREIREGFFHSDGSLRINETELRAWIAERAVDELKVVLQLSFVLSNCAHIIPSHILVRVAEQMSDEARHFDILRSLVPQDLQRAVDDKTAALPSALAADAHWTTLKGAVELGNPYAALLDINIVHEGYSAAAIEELKDIPFEDIRTAYADIGADEVKHHASGRDVLRWLIGASEGQLTAADTTTCADEQTVERNAMSWSSPHQTAADIVQKAHERAAEGGAMSWSWP